MGFVYEKVVEELQSDSAYEPLGKCVRVRVRCAAEPAAGSGVSQLCLLETCGRYCD